MLADVASGAAVDVDAAVRAARTAFEDGRWARRSPAERKNVLLALADLIEANGEELATVDSLEAGKPITDRARGLRRPAGVGTAGCAGR